MVLKNYIEHIKKDLPEYNPTPKGININSGTLQSRLDMRQATGRIWTSEAYESRRERVLSTPLT